MYLTRPTLPLCTPAAVWYLAAMRHAEQRGPVLQCRASRSTRRVGNAHTALFWFFCTLHVHTHTQVCSTERCNALDSSARLHTQKQSSSSVLLHSSVVYKLTLFKSCNKLAYSTQTRTAQPTRHTQDLACPCLGSGYPYACRPWLHTAAVVNVPVTAT